MNGFKLHEVRVSAPGKVILHGEHAVIYGKTAIAVCLGLRTTIVIKEVHSSGDPSVTVFLPSVELKETIDLKSIEPLIDHLRGDPATFRCVSPDTLDHEDHLRNVDKYLRETRPQFDSMNTVQQNSLRGFIYIFSALYGVTLYNFPLCSMDISMESELTVGAGTGSSASFAVCLAGALMQLTKVKCGNVQTEFSAKDKKIISAWAFNCERIMHGSPSGIDNSTCTFGSLISFRRGAEPRVLDFRLNLRILLVDTRVSRETRALAARVAALREWSPAAVDCVMQACDHITATATQILECISRSKQKADTKEQYQRLETLWDMNHCLLGALGVSHPALEEVRRAARAHGFASKLTGAGGGGYAMVLIPPSSRQTDVTALRRELEALGCCVMDTQLGGDGVRVHSAA